MIELQWRHAEADDLRKVPMLCGDEYVWLVLQVRERENPEEPQWPPIWGPWRDVPVEGE